jgi:exodeoxyribonuclease-5
MQLSADQEHAVRAIENWHKSKGKQVFRLFGYAGTGKTSVVARAVAQMGLNAVYAAFTGKAASVMVNNGIPATTIHRLIYKSKVDKPTNSVRFVLDTMSRAAYADLIVIDECSMVGSKIGGDLKSFLKPILVLGDPAQLPPVGDSAGYFTSAQPDVLLTEVHRQGAESGILTLATMARREQVIPIGKYAESEVIDVDDMEDRTIFSADQVLVGTNRTRLAITARIREHYGMSDQLPLFSERVVCTQNNYKFGVMNGETFIVLRCEKEGSYVSADLLREGGANDVLENVRIDPSPFLGGNKPQVYNNDVLFIDFAYAMTVHRAQGSQWNRVVIFDEGRLFREDANKWRYTAITRAAESAVLVKGRF